MHERRSSQQFLPLGDTKTIFHFSDFAAVCQSVTPRKDDLKLADAARVDSAEFETAK
jgi:hypothetical protein